jgi:hypothetical protein
MMEVDNDGLLFNHILHYYYLEDLVYEDLADAKILKEEDVSLS